MQQRYKEWFSRLEDYPELAEWVQTLRAESLNWFSENDRGDVGKWKEALRSLPANENPLVEVRDARLTFAPDLDVPRETLMQFHPWRKGPFQLGAHFVDTEWRSDWKWERVEKSINLEGKTVLDIGCGNGYYLWRMLECGAKWALGVDPYVPYVMQFQCMQHYAGGRNEVEVFPIGAEHLPRNTKCWDVVFSMGVLYHQKSPLEHLMHCRDLIMKGGEFILETIVLPPEYDKVTDCLVPEGRYAKMKNVNFLPSVAMLESWLRKVRFKKLEVIDHCKTTLEEQRSTDWMTFESLPNFLNLEDRELTVEGYPAPWRVVIKAEV